MPRRRYNKGDRDAAADEGALYGRNKGKGSSRSVESQSRVSTQGPIAMPSTVPGPLGFQFRNSDAYADNADRVQVLFRWKRFCVAGHIVDNNNGSTLPADSALQWTATYFTPNIYNWVHEMAQRRDGYRATVATVGNALTPQNYVNLLVPFKINIRVLHAMLSALLVNEGTRSMLPGFVDTQERILRLLELSNTLMYPSGLDAIIDYWSQIYMPYAGGPIVINYFDFQNLLATVTTSGTIHNWAATLPDLTDPLDIGYMLNDLDLVANMLLNYDLTAGTDAADVRLLVSLMSMMGFPTPATPSPLLKIDPVRFIEQLQIDAFCFEDTKGAGANTFLGWPDMAGSPQTMINLNFMGLTMSPDDIYWIGGKGLYAFEFDDDATPGYTAATNDISALGMVAPCRPDANGYIRQDTGIFTREDGWAAGPTAVDFTLAAGVQSWVWALPWITMHPEAWRAIMSEEAEETYHINLRGPGFQVFVDVFGQAHRKWYHELWGIPFLTS